MERANERKVWCGRISKRKLINEVNMKDTKKMISNVWLLFLLIVMTAFLFVSIPSNANIGHCIIASVCLFLATKEIKEV